MTGTILFVLPQSSPFLVKSLVWLCTVHFVDDYFICDLYHLLESLNFDNKDAMNTCFKHLVDCLDDIVNYHSPFKTKTIRKNNVPYMNNEWRRMMYKRNMMRNIKNKHPCPENYERYRILRNQCVNIGKMFKKAVLHWAMRRWSKQSTFLAYYQTIYNP